MYMIVLIIIVSLVLAREISGYHSRHNNRKYFVIKNRNLARMVLPKSIGGMASFKRAKADFNKMTYAGAIFYICNLLIILSIPVFLFLVPEIPTTPFEIDSSKIYIFVDTINEKVPTLLSFILFVVEAVFEVGSIIPQAKVKKQKWLIALSCLILAILVLFGLMMVKELIVCFI